MVPIAPSSTRTRSAASFLSSASTDGASIFARGSDIVSANSALALPLPLPGGERGGGRGFGPIDYAQDLPKRWNRNVHGYRPAALLPLPSGERESAAARPCSIFTLKLLHFPSCSAHRPKFRPAFAKPRLSSLRSPHAAAGRADGRSHRRDRRDSSCR